MSDADKNHPDIASPESAYYENEALWATDFSADRQERERLTAVQTLIPEDVGSVLDVGCGNGAFINAIAGRYRRVCGVDRSKAALKFVHVEAANASADNLPFGDQDFDLVTSLEVIEHLPQPVFKAAIAEIGRVAGRWVLITVPYQEDTRLGFVRCPQCLCEFNRSYHLRSFDDDAIADLFRRFGIAFELTTLSKIGSSPHFFGLYTAKYLAAPFRSPNLPAGVTCPQCAHMRPAAPTDYTTAGVRRSRGALGRLKKLWPHWNQPRWYLALFERKNR